MNVSTVLKASAIALALWQAPLLAKDSIASDEASYLHQYSVRASSAAPFAQVKWLEDGTLTAKVEKQWLIISRINDASVTKIMDTLINKENFSVGRSRMLLTQRLADVLSALDIAMPSDNQVTIDALTMDTKLPSDIKSVTLTKEKHSALRKHQAKHKPNKKKHEILLSYEQAIEDIDAYHQDLIERFAYLKANGVDHQRAIDNIKKRVVKTNTVTEIRNLVGEVTAMFIDGHAGPGQKFKDDAVSPFVVTRIDQRFVAINTDGESFVNADFPYITHIDGKPIGFWRDLMVPYIAKGSEQMVSRRALRAIIEIGTMRKFAKLPAKKQVTVRLTNESASKSKELTLDTIAPEQKPKTRLPKKTYQSRLLNGNLGYLRIAKMNDDAVKEIRQWMPKFKQTDGLIVDVRGNGGGSRKAWLELMPYFMKEGETHIGNIAAYRLYPEFKEDHLAGGRFSYMLKDGRLNDTERDAINQFKTTFSPEWQFDKSEFSPYHYFMSSKRRGDHRYFYDKKVVLLTNDGCFSATDIFAGAMKGWRNITLMGTATGGGSARTVAEKLPNSKIAVRLASMVSFQPSGLLYDGRGITVDNEVQPTPHSLLVGGFDNQLDSAISFLKNN